MFSPGVRSNEVESARRLANIDNFDDDEDEDFDDGWGEESEDQAYESHQSDNLFGKAVTGTA